MAKSGACRTQEKKIQDPTFPRCSCWAIRPLKMCSWIWCIYLPGLKQSSFFFCCCCLSPDMFGWINELQLWLSDIFQHGRHPDLDQYKTDCILIILFRVNTPAHQCTRFPALKMRITFFFFFIMSNFASALFPPSPLSIFAHFFCSQSSVSLNCIWNYRSSYHSLKRLVCPALCYIAVLSNPLVWSPVSLHFPH